MSMQDLFELINSGAIGAPNAPEKPLLAENLENRSTISINHFSNRLIFDLFDLKEVGSE
jgi:hypothetical protein